MSVSCQEETHAAQQLPALFNHLDGAQQDDPGSSTPLWGLMISTPNLHGWMTEALARSAY